MQFLTISDRYGIDRFRTISIGPVKLWWPFPIAAMLGGSSATVLGWAVYGSKAPWPIKRLHRMFSAVHRAKWWVKHRYVRRHQHHIVRTGLAPNWWDVDTLILHSCMALMCRYVEDEQGGADHLQKWADELRNPANVDPNAPEGMQEAQGEKEADVLGIYRWWKVTKPAEQARRDALITLLYGNKSRVSFEKVEGSKLSRMVFKEFEGNEIAAHKEFRALEEKMDDDEQKMLHRLIDLRRGMWT